MPKRYVLVVGTFLLSMLRNTEAVLSETGTLSLIDVQGTADQMNTLEGTLLIDSSAANPSAGDIRFVRAFYNDEGREDRQIKNDISELFQNLRWAMSRELGGDRMVSAGIHAIDTALLIIGSRPLKACGVVQQSRRNPVNSATDTASLTYTFPNGIVLNYSGDQFRNYHSEIDSFSGVKAYADHAHMQTFYGKGITQMRNADWRYKGGEDTNFYHWGARHNVDLFHKSVTGADYANTTVPGAVDANLSCLLGAYAGRAAREMTWDELINNDDKIEIDMSGLVL